MPVVAFAFGSFGDILATMQLLLKVISVLKDGQRSSERDETEKELKSLETDLANLTLLPIDETIQSSSPMAIWVAKRIQEEVQRCHLTILRFYQKCTASNGLIPKLLWAMSEEKELAAFKTRILERRTALAVVVGMLNLGALLAVKDRVEEVGQGTSRIRDVVQQSMSGLAQQQGTGQMREMVQESVNILAQQLAAYRQEIVAIHHVPRGVSEETFTVVNSTGVSIPIPLAYCRSWKDLIRILLAYTDGGVTDHGQSRTTYLLKASAGCTIVHRSSGYFEAYTVDMISTVVRGSDPDLDLFERRFYLAHDRPWVDLARVCEDGFKLPYGTLLQIVVDKMAPGDNGDEGSEGGDEGDEESEESAEDN